eukprot:Em0013g384a
MQQALEAQVVDKTETEHLLYGFLDMRAKTDDSLTVEQSETIVATVANENREGGVSNVEIAAIVGRRLAAVADEIDAKYDRELNEAVELTQTSEIAFGTFSRVARSLFEWTAGSIAKITMGRICALLAYCYRLCRHYIVQESLPASTLLVLLGSMGGCLVAFFTEVGFYAWLQEQGGWAQLLAGSVSALVGSHSMLATGVLLIGGGVLLIGGWAWSKW